jgi:hypothetical protein
MRAFILRGIGRSRVDEQENLHGPVSAQIYSVSMVALGLAWLYAISRHFYRAVHIDPIRFPHRKLVFLCSLFALLGIADVCIFSFFNAGEAL